jgi:biopolymer transport protein ExbD
VFLNDELIPDGELKSRLQAVKAADSDPKFVIKGDDNVDYQNVIKVIDALQQLDITKVGLATL